MCRKCRNHSVTDTYWEVLWRDAKPANALTPSKLRTWCANMNVIMSQHRSRSRLKPRQYAEIVGEIPRVGDLNRDRFSLLSCCEDDQRGLG